MPGAHLLKNLNANKDKTCPDGAPIEFIPNNLKEYIIDDSGKLDRHGWETALLKSIRDEIKLGNLSASNSKFFCAFDNLFMPSTKWNTVRKEFFKKSGLPSQSSREAHY